MSETWFETLFGNANAVGFLGAFAGLGFILFARIARKSPRMKAKALAAALVLFGLGFVVFALAGGDHVYDIRAINVSVLSVLLASGWGLLAYGVTKHKGADWR